MLERVLDAVRSRYSGAYAGARFATGADLESFEGMSVVGPNGGLVGLGRRSGRALRMHAARNVRIVSPPGTGKSTRILAPALLSTPRCSFVVHDPIGELWEVCSGWLARSSQTWGIDWNATGTPANGVLHPSFNVLGEGVVPDGDREREAHCAALAEALLPNTGAGDGYFTTRARETTAALALYALAQAGCENRAPGMARGATAKLATIAALAREATDGQMLEAIGAHARAKQLPATCTKPIDDLIAMAEKERAGVLNALLMGFIASHFASFDDRTRETDFVPSDLGGVLTPQALGELGLAQGPRTRAGWDAIESHLRPDMWAPVALFVLSKRGAHAPFKGLTAVLLDACARAVANVGAGDRTQTGAVMGPFPVGFILDECESLAHIPSLAMLVRDGPANGRFCIAAAQHTEGLYAVLGGGDERENIDSAFMTEVVLAQNDRRAINALIARVGHNARGRALLDTAQIAGIQRGKHLLVHSERPDRPVRCAAPAYYEDKTLRARAGDTRRPKAKHAMAPAPRRPDFATAARG